jgi:acyl phosphate:glycerol-3-phosphate acyltransferase
MLQVNLLVQEYLGSSTSLIGWIGWFLSAYLLGSIQVAWLIAKVFSHQDLRMVGSGNVGVMNTALSISRWAGLLVFLSEIGKGVLATAIPLYLNAGEQALFLTIMGVVVGTRWPFWLKFKGGRGNTAGFSALMVISFYIPLISFFLWSLAYMCLKCSFYATRLTILALPAILWLTTGSWWFVLTGIVLSLMYLQAQKRESDDHLLINEEYSSFFKFLFSPSRKR